MRFRYASARMLILALLPSWSGVCGGAGSNTDAIPLFWTMSIYVYFFK